MGKHTRLKKLAKHLLATTCLTAGVAGIASAQTVNEGADFGNTFNQAFSLPVGTRTVNGGLDTLINSDFVDGIDFFKFSGLLGGSAFSFTGTTPTSEPLALEVRNSDNSLLLNSIAFEGLSTGGSNTVPLDGILVFDIKVTGESHIATTYNVNLTATDAISAAPEPGTIGAMGLGLAAVAGFARRRRKKI